MKENRRYSMKTVVLFALLTAAATLLLTFFFMWQFYGLGSPLREETSRFREAREILSARYVGRILDEGYLTDVALAAAVNALGDTWSRFLTADEHAAHLRNLDNRRQGLGLSITRDEETGELQIIGVAPGSPAEEAGLVVGEAVVTIEGAYVSEMSLEQFRETVDEGCNGSVHLGVRDAAGVLRTVEVAVRAFYVNPVSFELLESGVGYIRIVNFEGTSGEGAVYAIESLLRDGAEGLVFDLRDNRGGRLSELLVVLDRILPEGELVVFADYSGRERVRYSDAAYLRVPMAVLVNERTASAAEYFAAILQEKEWAVIVGTPTTGKGRSQVLFPLSGGGAILLSTSRYLTPGRVDLYEAGGIEPDVLEEDAALQLEQAETAILDDVWFTY